MSGSPDPGQGARRSFLTLVAVWITLDQIAKAIVAGTSQRGEILATVIPSWFEISHSRNPGAAFGMLGGQPAARWFFALVAVGALVAVYYYRRQIWRLPAVQRMSLALVAAGAAGNLIDRLLRGGQVVDFIRIYLPRPGGARYGFPDFNIADIGVTCGMIVYLASTLWADWKASRTEHAGAADELEAAVTPAES